MAHRDTNPKNSLSEDDITEFESAARPVGQPFVVLTATTAVEIDAAFATAAKRSLSALVVDLIQGLDGSLGNHFQGRRR